MVNLVMQMRLKQATKVVIIIVTTYGKWHNLVSNSMVHILTLLANETQNNANQYIVIWTYNNSSHFQSSVSKMIYVFVDLFIN
jgi:hypothetical protein